MSHFQKPLYKAVLNWQDLEAFSSEVDTGSRQENAIKQRSGAAFRFRGI
jgi:hypothetical protein